MLSFTRYIDITSVVGGANVVPVRSFGGRFFTINSLLPPNSFLQESTLTQVGDYFGTDSEEYARASFYFGWISKNGRKAQLVSFARWTDVDTAPYIIGAVLSQVLGTYTSITDGSFSLTIGATTNVISGLDFSAAVSLAGVAAVIETAINAETGTMWTAATVTFDAIRGSFNFTGGDAVVATLSVANAVGGTALAPLIGWLTGAIIGYGTLAESVTDVLDASYNASNNFGSCAFLPALTLDEMTEAAVWTDGKNVRVMYCPPVSLENASAYATALAAYSGVGMTVSETTDEYPEQIPMMIFAATDYSAANSTQNYEFQQFVLTPSVTDDSVGDELDTESVNYYGVTQESGDGIAFYQTGVLFGLATAPLDMNTFTNEIWLKSAVEAAIMTLLLSVAKLSANTQGLSQLASIIQPVINQGLSNGTISIGKPFTPAQQAYVTSVTGDPLAWYQVQNGGYWFNPVIVPFTALNGRTQYKANYTLVYSKDDAIRKVTGTDILI